MVNTYAVQSGGRRFESLWGFGFCLKGAHYEVCYCGKKTYLAGLQCTLTSSCAKTRLIVAFRRVICSFFFNPVEMANSCEMPKSKCLYTNIQIGKWVGNVFPFDISHTWFGLNRIKPRSLNVFCSRRERNAVLFLVFRLEKKQFQ